LRNLWKRIKLKAGATKKMKRNECTDCVYCLQNWSNRTDLSGKKIAKAFGETGVEHLNRNYKIYHIVDPMYAFKDCKDCLNILM
jgi:hypothetical protein